MCVLSTLPKTFGLSVKDKSLFSNQFKTKEHKLFLMYEIPDRKFFQLEFMKIAEGKKFDQWYEKQKTVDQQLNGSTLRFHLPVML